MALAGCCASSQRSRTLSAAPPSAATPLVDSRSQRASRRGACAEWLVVATAFGSSRDVGLFDALAHVDAEEGTAAAPTTASGAAGAATRSRASSPQGRRRQQRSRHHLDHHQRRPRRRRRRARRSGSTPRRTCARWRVVASARRGRTMTAGASAAEQCRPSMKNVLSKLMLKVWAIDEGPTTLVDKWLARDDFIGAYTFATKGNAAVCAPIFSSDDDKFLKLACDWSAAGGFGIGASIVQEIMVTAAGRALHQRCCRRASPGRARCAAPALPRTGWSSHTDAQVMQNR